MNLRPEGQVAPSNLMAGFCLELMEGAIGVRGVISARSTTLMSWASPGLSIRSAERFFLMPQPPNEHSKRKYKQDLEQ